MASAGGLPVAAMVGHHPLLTQQQQQQLAAARAAPGQHLRAQHAAVAVAQAQAAVAAADAKRLAGKKRKAQEKPVAEKAVHLIPESPLFNSLMMQEHHLDELIKRKRLELQAAANPLECPVHKRLRVYISNTHSHQHAAAAAAAGADQSEQSSASSNPHSEPPQWTLTIWGRLDNPDPPPPPPPAAAVPPPPAAAAAAAAGSSTASAAPAAAAAGSSSAAAPPPPQAGEQGAAVVDVNKLPPQPTSQQQHAQHKYPFTGFFKRIGLRLDPEVYPDDSTVTWEKLQHRGPHKDSIEVKRVGSQPSKVTITFEQDFAMPVYKVDPRLAEVLGMTFGHQQMVQTRLYSYIISAAPQPDLSQLQLDAKLEPIFGTKQLAVAALPQALGALLQPLEPVTITHAIGTSGPSPGSITCVDFDVFLPTKLQDRVAPAVDPLLDNKQFDALEQKLTTQLSKLFEARRRRSMYLGFAQDPVAFLNTIIASQARELRMGRSGKELAVERRTDLFRERWVDEAALRYLGRKTKQESLFPALQPAGPGQG